MQEIGSTYINQSVLDVNKQNGTQEDIQNQIPEVQPELSPPVDEVQGQIQNFKGGRASIIALNVCGKLPLKLHWYCLRHHMNFVDHGQHATCRLNVAFYC